MAVVTLGAILAAAGHGRIGNEERLAGALPGRLSESKGKSFYVDGSRGVDSGPGTLAKPWRSINYALRRVATSGSVVFVRAGTYTGMVRWERAGDPRNPVTLRAYPGEHVLLTAAPGTQTPAILIQNGGGIIVRGFEVTSPTSDVGIKVENGNDVEIVRCDIHHTGRSGVLVAGTGKSAPTGSQNVQIWNNRFHDNGGNPNAGSGSAGMGGHSIYWGGISSNTDGLDHTTYGGVIANNLFYNQPNGFQLQIGSEASGLIVTNNTFYRATYPSPGGNAIVLYTESKSPQFITRNVLIVNNLITYANNKGVYGSGGGGLMSTNVVRNNLAYGNAQGDFLSYYGSTSNVLFTLGTNITGRLPLYVSPRVLDFRLQAKSPAIDRAELAYAPTHDYLGQRRFGAPDLGAFERVPPRAKNTTRR